MRINESVSLLRPAKLVESEGELLPGEIGGIAGVSEHDDAFGEHVAENVDGFGEFATVFKNDAAHVLHEEDLGVVGAAKFHPYWRDFVNDRGALVEFALLSEHHRHTGATRHNHLVI